MHALPEGRTKDLAASSISLGIAERDLKAAVDMASEISDTGIRTQVQQDAAGAWFSRDRAAAIRWMQSLPVGPTKDSAASGISQGMARNDPKAGVDMTLGIGGSNLRIQMFTQLATFWLRKDPVAATQRIHSSALPQQVKTQLLQR
jgi:hypothetical protein